MDRVHDSTSIRVENQRAILRLLWRLGESSRADLARRTGLSRSTVSSIVAELLETGLVRETRSGASTGGRRPIMLAFAYDAAVIVGVELGASHIIVGITDLRAQVRATRRSSFDVREEPDGALTVVEAFVSDLLKEARRSTDEVVAIGVGAPSPIDPREPGRLSPTVVPKWRGFDVASRLDERFGRPVLVDNDANLGALAELWWGAGRDGGDLVFVKVATGIGAGLVLGGRVFRGAAGIAGELGHLSIDPTGPECMCGLRGCLATFVGTRQILDRVLAARDGYRASPLREDPVDLPALVAAVRANDPLAIEVVQDAGRILGIGVAGLLNVLNPARVILGGELVAAGDALLTPLRHTVKSRALAESIAHAEIDASQLGDHVIVVGAASLVLEAALDDPSLFPQALQPAQE